MPEAHLSSDSKRSTDRGPLSAVAALAARPFTSLDEVIAAALQLMSDAIGVRLSMIHRLEGASLVVSHMHDQLGLGIDPPVELPRSDTFCDVVLSESAPLIVSDADLEPWSALPGKQFVGTKTYIGVPIVLNEGRLFGTLCAHDRRSLELGQAEIDILLLLARLVASHIEREETLRIEADTARRLAIRNAELAEVNQQLRALNQITESVATNLDLKSLLETVVASGAELLRARGGAISLLGESVDAPRRLTATYNLPESLSMEPIPASAGLMGQVLAARGPVIVERYQDLENPLGHAFFRELAPWVAVPIWWQDEIIGTFGLGSDDPERIYNDHDIALLTQFAKHAAIAIENARLYAASRDFGASEERNRLAAEIHDTLAQSLLALTFQLRSARSSIASAPDRAIAEIDEAERRARTALDEARRSVWNLGPAALEAGSLVEALQSEAAASERAGLPVRLVVTGRERSLESETQLALFRIAQEALANARKHSGARHADIALDFDLSEVSIRIDDDGSGFDAAEAVRRGPRLDSGYGLIAMRERVARCGGTLIVSSDPTLGGTRICARIPYIRTAELPASATGTASAVIRVVICDDHPAVRSGVAAMLASAEGIEVVAIAENGGGALAAVEANTPDILLIDLRMPGMSGIDVIDQLRARRCGTRAIVLTTVAQDELVYQAMRAGAKGFLLKDAQAADVVGAIRVVHAGGTVLAPAVAGTLAGNLGGHDRLTARERQVLDLMAQGYPDKEIAATLGTSIKTASFHAANVLSKLGAANRAEAVRLAIERGLID